MEVCVKVVSDMGYLAIGKLLLVLVMILNINIEKGKLPYHLISVKPIQNY